MSVGSRIKEARESKGMSQVSLADKISVSKQTLYKYENDIITNVPSDKIEAISKALNVSPQYIMGWDEPPAADQNDILAPDEKRLVGMYRKYNDIGKAKLMGYAEAIIDSPECTLRPGELFHSGIEADDNESLGRRA